MMVLASKKIPVSEYSPAQIKLTIAGSGKASKIDILDAVMYNLDLDKPPKPDDSADALAIALTKLNEDGFNWKFNMKIFENKKLERDTFRKLRDGISHNQSENVVKNVKLYVDSFIKEYKNIGYIGIYWTLKNEVDLRSLKEKFSLALPRCKDKNELLFFPWDEEPFTKDFEGILSPNNSLLPSHLGKDKLNFFLRLLISTSFFRGQYMAI